MAYKGLGGDLAKRLLGVGVIWPKDSLVLIQPRHQEVFWPDPTHRAMFKFGAKIVFLSCHLAKKMSAVFSANSCKF